MNKKICFLCVVVLLFSLVFPALVIAGKKAEEEEAVEVEVAGPDAYENYVSSVPRGAEPVPRECFEQAMEEGHLVWSDWVEWWPDEIHEDFAKEFGIEVRRDHHASHDEALTKFKLNPDAAYDLVQGMGTEGAIKAVEMGITSKVIWEWVPNMVKYLPETTKEKDWLDLGINDDIFIFGFFVEGMTYNKKLVDDPRVPSWGILFEPLEKYRGRICVADNANLVIGNVLTYLGYSRNSVNEAELMEAKEVLLKLKPYIIGYDIYPSRLLFAEEALIAHAGCSADTFVMRHDKEDLWFALPAEGSTKGFDTIFMPPNPPNKAAAHLFMNWLYRPDNYLSLIEWIGHSPTHTGIMDRLSKELLEFPGVVFPEGYLEKSEYPTTASLTGKGLELRRQVWEELKQ